MIGGRKIEYYTKRLYNRLENEKNTLTNHLYIYIYIYIYILHLKRGQVKIKYPKLLEVYINLDFVILYIYIKLFLYRSTFYHHQQCIFHQMHRYFANIYHHIISIEVFLYWSTSYLHQQRFLFYFYFILFFSLGYIWFFGIDLQCLDTTKLY